MTEKHIRRLLHQANDAQLRRIGKYKASGMDEQERIFERVRSQLGTHGSIQPAEPRIVRADKAEKWDWLHGVGTAAAVCAMLALTVGSITFFQNRAPESPLDAASNIAAPTDSCIPFAAEIAGKELTFVLEDIAYGYSLNQEQEQAFLRTLETLSWEQKGGYNATDEEPYRISGSYFTVYAGNRTPNSDGYCIEFALDEGDVLFSSLQGGSPISIYSLSAEEYDRLFQIAAAGMTANYVYYSCHEWDIRAARSEGVTAEIPEEQTAQFWEAFKDVRLDYTKLNDPLPDAETEGPAFTVTCFRRFPDVGKEIEPFQIVFYRDRILWYPSYDPSSASEADVVKQFGISPEDCGKLRVILFADGAQYCLHLKLDAQNVTRCGLMLLLSEYADESAREILYGSDFSLSKYADGGWHPCPTVIDNAAFTSEGYLYTGEITSIPIDWRWIYGTLEPGHYRIGKGFGAKQKPSEEYTHYTLYAEFDISDDMGESLPLSELPFPAESFGTDEIVGMETAYVPYLEKIPADVQQQIADAMERSYWIPMSAQSVTWDGETNSLFVRGKASDTPYRMTFVPTQSAVLVYLDEEEAPLAYQISWELYDAASRAGEYLQDTDDVMQYLIPCEVEELTVCDVWKAADRAAQD